MKLYEHKTADQRFRNILQACKDFVPIDNPASLPFFPNMPHIDPYRPEANGGLSRW